MVFIYMLYLMNKFEVNCIKQELMRNGTCQKIKEKDIYEK
jgi:hypothetical protein